ncbi:3'-5' exonuclease family protein [Crenobacter cavernae]|uniref:DNA-directed DNA polymerase n=1 Tax=Crenobacter cavernae TaxID=2290923 RepID=A0ABY0FGN0_9NEIS|nr:3'-5' exonuclease family protein [Crenobacter cavernae]RXZ45548.1 ethanolamine utilization protein [Crenobacter cavernae]
MLFDRPCAIVDLETTGGHITRDRITEIGVILVDGDRVERFSTLVQPGKAIPPFIEKMTGISDAMVEHAPAFETLAEDLAEKLAGRLFIAHNARFDYGFLKNAFKRAGIRFQTEVLCSVKLSRKLYPQFYKHNLDSLIERHGIELAERHRALADAEAVWLFLQKAKGELGEATMADAVAEVLARPTVPEGIDPDVVDALPDVPGVYLFYGDDDVPLFVGKGANLRSCVLSYFSGDTRHPKEARIAREVKRIDWVETVGEFGAMLAELQLIKRLQPLHNVKGRPSPELCSIRLEKSDDGVLRPEIVFADDVDFSRSHDLFGLFRTQREAKKALTDLATAQGLCQTTLGIEKPTPKKGRPCYAWPLGRCRGACMGREPIDNHNARLMMALSRLRVQSWPFPGPVAVVETDAVSGDIAEHVFDRWCYLGTRRDTSGPLEGQPSFDLDTYKLLGGLLKKTPDHTELRLLDTEPV